MLKLILPKISDKEKKFYTIDTIKHWSAEVA